MGYTNYLSRPSEIDGYDFNCFLADSALLVAAWYDYCTGTDRSIRITYTEVIRTVEDGLYPYQLFRLNDDPDLAPDGLWKMLAILEQKGDFRSKGANLACHFVRLKKLHLGFPSTSESEDVYISTELREWENTDMVFCKTNRDQPFDMLVSALFALAEEKTHGAFKFTSDDVHQQEAGWELLRAVFGSRRFPVRPAFKVRNPNHIDWAKNVLLETLLKHPDLKIDDLMPLIFARLNERFQMKRVNRQSLKSILIKEIERLILINDYGHCVRSESECTESQLPIFRAIH